MSDWRDNLQSFFSSSEEKRKAAEMPDMERFISGIVVPAFQELLPELQKHGRDVTIRAAETSAALIVQNQGEEEMTFRVQGRTFPTGVLPYAEIRYRQRRGLRLITTEQMFRSAAPRYTIRDLTRDDVIRCFLDNYTRRVRTD